MTSACDHAGCVGAHWPLSPMQAHEKAVIRTAKERAAVVAEAKTWLGTPYHHHARVKGAGVDCANLPAAVYESCGLIPNLAPSYSEQWHKHRDEEIYLSWVTPHAREIDRSSVQPGDFAIWKFGRTFSHGAIIIDPPIVIHSYIGLGVVMADMDEEEELLPRRPVRFFTLWGI